MPWSHVVISSALICPTNLLLGQIQQVRFEPSGKVWVVGFAYAVPPDYYQMFAARYDPATGIWTPHYFDSVDADTYQVKGLAVVGNDDVYVSTEYQIDHWAGSAWATVLSTSGFGNRRIAGLLGFSSSDVIAPLYDSVYPADYGALQSYRGSGGTWTYSTIPYSVNPTRVLEAGDGAAATQVVMSMTDSLNPGSPSMYAVNFTSGTALPGHGDFSHIPVAVGGAAMYAVNGGYARGGRDATSGAGFIAYLAATDPLYGGPDFYRFSPDLDYTLPNVGYEQYLAALAANDAWVIGQWDPGTGLRTAKASHWDGTAFTTTDLPLGPYRNPHVLNLRMRASNDVWAVGSLSCTDGITGLSEYMAAWHWDGSVWTLLTIPA